MLHVKDHDGNMEKSVTRKDKELADHLIRRAKKKSESQLHKEKRRNPKESRGGGRVERARRHEGGVRIAQKRTNYVKLEESEPAAAILHKIPHSKTQKRERRRYATLRSSNRERILGIDRGQVVLKRKRCPSEKKN